MFNPIEFDGHFVCALYNGRERVGVTVVHHDEMFGGGDMLLMYELFDGEDTMPSFRVNEPDLLEDYGSVAERAGSSEDMSWIKRLATPELREDFILLFRCILIATGKLKLRDADPELMRQLQWAMGEFGDNPAAWSDAAIEAVRQLSLNEAARAREAIIGRNRLAKMLAEQMNQEGAAASS